MQFRTYSTSAIARVATSASARNRADDAAGRDFAIPEVGGYHEELASLATHGTAARVQLRANGRPAIARVAPYPYASAGHAGQRARRIQTEHAPIVAEIGVAI